MTSHRQLLQTQFAPLTSKRNREAFFAYLKESFPQTQKTGNGIVIGDLQSAKLVLSAGFRGDLSGAAVLTELAAALTAPMRAQICLVYADTPGLFPGKTHVRIGEIAKGNLLLISASGYARKHYGKAIKKAFLPGKTTSVRFTKAEGLFRRFGKEQVITVTAKTKRFTAAPEDNNNIKLVCEGILRLLKAI